MLFSVSKMVRGSAMLQISLALYVHSEIHALWTDVCVFVGYPSNDALHKTRFCGVYRLSQHLISQTGAPSVRNTDEVLSLVVQFDLP